MAGGTGGHVFPGLAIAKRFKEKGIEVEWLGTEKGFEAKSVPAAGIKLHPISISGLRGKGLKTLLLAPFRLLIAVYQAFCVIRKVKPEVVIGMGGFASGPGGIAAWLQRVPLVIHEQNAKPGMTNRWLAKIASKVLEGFPGTFKVQPHVIGTGNPVRVEIANGKLQRTVHQPIHLLIVGGSLGAEAINKIVPEMLSKLPKGCLIVYHQTGEKHYDETLKRYQLLGVEARVVPFIADMGEAYSWADIVLCRAGALTIAELCAAGVGAVLVPFPHAVDDHQTANAFYMVNQGAAFLIQQRDLTLDRLVGIMSDFIATPEKCVQMANAAYELRKIDATENVVAICEGLIH